ncbi:MAG: hypothetical protein JXA03_10890 [Bacteroidales bacterium]|nr:hypothetical protein [Bacteroidales bacterium]
MKIKYILLVIMFSVAYNFLSAQALKVEPNTSLRVESGATLDLTGGNLVIESDASGDASLVDYGNITYSGSGQANVECYLTEGQWHLISSPVSNAVSGMFLGDYLQHHNESANLWTFITPTTLPLDIMKGFALWSVEPAPSTEVFTGITNAGPQSRIFTQNGDGWNFMENPYPSAIDWDEVTIPAQLNGAFWLWDPTIGTSGDYVFYITGGGIATPLRSSFHRDRVSLYEQLPDPET